MAQLRKRENEIRELENVYLISDRSKELAFRIARRYVRGLFTRHLERIPYQLDNDLDLKDLVKELGILSTQLDQLASIGYIDDIPCLVIGSKKIPINAAKYIANPNLLPDELNRREILDSSPGKQLETLVQIIKRTENRQFSTIKGEELDKSLTSDIGAFVLVRQASTDNEDIKESMFSYLKKPPSAGGGPTGFLTIDLTVATPTLDIQCSPAYFINWDYFGSPSRHVVGYLKPGKFIFGGSGPSLSSMKVSSIKVDIPPNFTISLNDI